MMWCRPARMTLVLGWVWLVGCGARSALQVAGSEDHRPGTDASLSGDAASVRDDARQPGQITLQDPVDVCVRDSPGCDLYDGITALAWTGERYGLLFQQRADEGPAIHLALRFIDPDGTVSESLLLSDETNQPRGGDLIWDGERLVAVWKGDRSGDIHARGITPAGELAGPAQTVIDATSTTYGGPLALATDEGVALVATFSDDQARFVRLSRYPALALLDEPARLYWPGVSERSWARPGRPIALPTGGYAVTLNPREAGPGGDSIHVAHLDRRGRPDSEALAVHTADTVTGGQMILQDDRLWVAYNDDFEALFLAEIQVDRWAVRQRVRLQHEGDVSRPVLVPAAGSTVAMLGATNLWVGPGSFPTTLVFETFELPGGGRRAQLTVDDRAGSDGGVLHFAMVRSGDSVGIAWEPIVHTSALTRIVFARITGLR